MRCGSGNLEERYAVRQWALGREICDAAVGTRERDMRCGSGHSGERYAMRQWALGREVGEATMGKTS